MVTYLWFNILKKLFITKNNENITRENTKNVCLFFSFFYNSILQMKGGWDDRQSEKKYKMLGTSLKNRKQHTK